MAFVKKEWKDRLVEFAGRRKLKNVETNESMTVDVTRNEGDVLQAGDAFSSENMNSLEGRIYTGFDGIVKIYTNVSIAASVWVTYTAQLDYETDIAVDYPYKADIPLQGITAQHCAHIGFAPAEVKDGVFAPYNNTQNGTVRIYAKSKPINAVAIPTITAIAKGV